MEKLSVIFLGLAIVVATAITLTAHAATPSVFVVPETVIQGEPIRITVEGVDASSVKNISFDGRKLNIFSYQGKATSLAPIDLNKNPGTYKLVVIFADATVEEREIVVSAREKIEAPLGIPEKLGGNTKESQTKLVSTLASENQKLIGLRTGTHAFWKEPFRFPVANPMVTDPYGYSRKTGEYSIAHKGTDFRAKEGTPVLAMNRGVVRQVREYRNYGKTVVVDHGLGLMTIYMHLSKIKVNPGELVLPGQVIALSGSTGYSESPHLHLSVRINDISIDPVTFLELFK